MDISWRDGAANQLTLRPDETGAQVPTHEAGDCVLFDARAGHVYIAAPVA